MSVALAAPALTILGLLGLAIGSFLNVVAYRVPNGLSVVSPASACPGCETPIRRRDNLPVIGWVLLGGRCRDCRMRISARYPLIEAVTGLAFVVVTLVALPAVLEERDAAGAAAAGLEFAALLYLAAVSVLLAVIDLDIHRLPNAIVYPSFVVLAVLLAAAGALRGDLGALGLAGIGAVASTAFYFALAFAYPGGMGMGDVKFAAVLGLVLGYGGLPQLVVGTAAAFVLGGLVGVVLLAARRAERRSGIPFGPWMIAGAWVGIFAGEPIADAYLSLAGLT